jgi:hypothetical protein
MAAAMPFAAPPISSYSVGWETVLPVDAWGYVYASLQAYKAHVQEYPGCQRFEAFASPTEAGEIRLQCYATWDTPEQLEGFLERGYTLERMLADIDAPAPERTLILEKVF